MSPARLRAEFTPWGGKTARTQALATLVGAALIVIGWWGGSGSSRPSTQLNWLIMAAAGAIVAGVGHAVYLLDAHRRVAQARRDLVTAVALPPVAAPSPDDGVAVLVAVPGTRRYHRPDCHLVVGKAAGPVQAGVDDRSPCEVCRP